MPNGVDKNLVRLAVAAAVYRRRFGEWPSEVRLAPIVLWDIANLLDSANFEALAARLKLRTSEKAMISVGGSHGYIRYEDVTHEDAGDLVSNARAWLGVEIRPDIEHY